MGTPAKRTPQLSITHYSDVRFADKNRKSLVNMLIAHIYLFIWSSSFYIYISLKLHPPILK